MQTWRIIPRWNSDCLIIPDSSILCLFRVRIHMYLAHNSEMPSSLE